jgi:simple sugar transport system ATP-binding protein
LIPSDPSSGSGLSLSAEPVLRLSGISKRFGELVANDNICLSLGRGEVLALLGENGAGKSTLVSILFGHYRADAGSIEVFGRELPGGNPRAALEAGIGMVHQHVTLADNLSVLDNVMLGTEALWRWRSRRAQGRSRLLEVAGRFGLQVDPQARVANLSLGERQRVEILKALYRGARILILDEPTAVLTPRESDALFDTLAEMVRQGLSIVFISHKLAEVLRVSHRVVVLRQGRKVAEALTQQTDALQLAQWMVGHPVNKGQREASPHTGQVVCELREVRCDGASGDRLNGVSLALHAGEIVAIAGISGHGQSALADLLCGMRRPSAGRVVLQGVLLPTTPAALIAAGVARIPEDRAGVGILGDLPVWENAVAERIRAADFSRGGWIRAGAAREFAAGVIREFDVRGAGPMAAARALSGGNMQKLIIGRALAPKSGGASPLPQLVVAHQPTWGLDVGAVAFVQQRLFEARAAGAAVLLISDDLDEVFDMGDRVAVMVRGRLSEAKPPAQWSRAEIGLAMAGGSRAA